MKRTLVTLTALSLIAIASPMFAAESHTDLAVSAEVIQNCTITTSPVAFGTYDTITGAAVSGAGAVNVACTKGSSLVTIDLSTGANPTHKIGSDNRAMGVGGSWLSYDLYTDTGHTSRWLTGVSYTALDSAVHSIDVYGLIAANQDVPQGSYADTVVAKINY